MTNFELALLLDVENNFALLPHVRVVDGKPTPQLTFCNCYASVWCAARGAQLPPVLANKQLLYLRSKPDEWEEVSRERALELVNGADRTELVLAVADAAVHGHIGACLESPPEDPKHLYVSAAGARNFRRAKLEASFGFLKPIFFRRRKE